MFSPWEIQGQSNLLDKSGTIELNTDYSANRKPAWLVLLKLLGVAAMVGVGGAIVLPTLLQFKFPLLQGIAITAGGMLIYTGIAFFIRPEPNTDNLGWGGGMMNDPFQCSDNVNRFLWKAHCVLGPGRFTAETLLDLCMLLGIAKTEEELASEPAFVSTLAADVGVAPANSFDASRPIAPLDPNRFAQSSGNFVVGQIQLDSQRYFSSMTSGSSAGCND
jgi:hypothetical protein